MTRKSSAAPATAQGGAAHPPLEVGARPHKGTVDYPGGQVAWIEACLVNAIVSIVCGRDVGKTVFLWFLFLEEGRRCRGHYDFAYVAQGHPQAEKVFKSWKRELENAGILVGSNNKGQDRWIEVQPFGSNQGATIHFWSGEEGALSNIRGVRLNRLAVDEAGFVSPEVRPACRGMLLSRGGRQVFVGTPKREGPGFVWFKDAYDRGWEGEPGYVSFNAPSESNPFTPPGSVAQARREYRSRTEPDVKTPEEREEFDGEFVTDLGACFRNLDACFTLPVLRVEANGLHVGADPIPGRAYVIGQDWGKKHDPSVSSVFDRETRQQVALRLERVGAPYEDQMARLDSLHRHYNRALIVADAGDAGSYINERLRIQYGDRMHELMLTAHGAENKGYHVSRMKHLFDTEGWHLLREPLQVSQFQEFQQIPIGERGTGFYYEAPRGKHDDTVTAALFASTVLQHDVVKRRPAPPLPAPYSMEWFEQKQKERVRQIRRRGF